MTTATVAPRTTVASYHRDIAYCLEILAETLEDIRDLAGALVVPQRGLDDCTPSEASRMLRDMLEAANRTENQDYISFSEISEKPLGADDPAESVYALLGELQTRIMGTRDCWRRYFPQCRN